jgi:hypothetical protein
MRTLPLARSLLFVVKPAFFAHILSLLLARSLASNEEAKNSIKKEEEDEGGEDFRHKYRLNKIQ